jgi:peptidoglycan/LPS O-acetylase OafA/YrhL
MFFALSGYLMGEVLFIKKPALTEFFFRRFSRIIPTFLLFVGCMYVYAYFQARPYPVSSSELLATLLFVRTYIPEHVSIWNTGWAIGNIWSLNVEEHSYIFLAILALISRRLKNERVASALLISSVAASIFFFCLYLNNPPPGDRHWQLRSECAAVGLIFSALLRQLRGNHEAALSHDTWNLVILTSLLSIPLIALFKFAALRVIVVPMFLALMVNYLGCFPVQLRNFLSARWFVWFGKRSFSLYLWQQPFFIAVDQNLIPKSLGLCLGIAVGTLSFVYFEDPLRIKLNRAWSKRRDELARAEAESAKPI